MTLSDLKWLSEILNEHLYSPQVVAKKYKQQFKQTNAMYNRQTKDNKKWCDLATLTNVYSSDNIHHYLVDNKGKTLITDTVKYRNIKQA